MKHERAFASKIVTTNLETHRSIAIPPDLRAAIERFGYVS